MNKECPKCEGEMELIEPEPDVGIVGGWECDCGHNEPYEPSDFEPEP